MDTSTSDQSKLRAGKEKVLLLLLPYWTPLIPPQGILNIKTYLQNHGYTIVTADANTEVVFKELYERYFGAFKEFIPESHWGNFYNIGHDVLRNHMMAHIHRTDEQEYVSMVRILIYETFYHDFTDAQIGLVNNIIAEYYEALERYISDLLDNVKPDVLGLSSLLGTLPSSMFAAKVAKLKCPELMTVVGGTIFVGQIPVNSPDYHYFLEKTPYIDKFIVGEGEILLLKLLRGELPESKRVYTLEDIQGERVDISSFVIADHSDLNVQYYPYLAASGSRSCPYQCKFCNVAGFWGEYTPKDVKQVVSEMTGLYQRYHKQLFFMLDSLLNPIVDELAGQFIDSGTSLYWDGYFRVHEEACNTEKTLFWRQGGFYRARIGVESGSQRILDLMDKKISVEQTKAALSALAYAGIKTTAYIVIGFPGETEADFEKTLELLEVLKNDIWEAECNPFYYYFTGQPNSSVWESRRTLLYPEKMRDLLITQSWIVDCEPNREETFHRIFRLNAHCQKLGIPNPYTEREIYYADERWKKLHKNAVPSVLEFKNTTRYLTENRNIKRLSFAQDTPRITGDFSF